MKSGYSTLLVGLALAVTAGSMMLTSEGIGAGGNDEFGPESGAEGEYGPFPLPGGARLESDLAYGPYAKQRLDIYHPAAPNGAAILMVHGGGWTRGNKALWRVVRQKVNHWVAKGYILVSINYRMVPEADPLTQAGDVAQALAFVQGHLRSWGGDPARVVMMGHSSGAHLVALMTADASIAARAGASAWVAAVSLDSAAMNVEAIMRRRHMSFYDQVFKDDPEFWRAASPTLRLTGKPVSPLLAVCSSQRLDSCPQARRFAARATELGGRVEVLPVDLSHPQINGFLGVPGAYTDAVDAFLKTAGLP